MVLTFSNKLHILVQTNINYLYWNKLVILAQTCTNKLLILVQTCTNKLLTLVQTCTINILTLVHFSLRTHETVQFGQQDGEYLSNMIHQNNIINIIIQRTSKVLFKLSNYATS